MFDPADLIHRYTRADTLADRVPVSPRCPVPSMGHRRRGRIVV
jgi:hypothetical protein